MKIHEFLLLPDLEIDDRKGSRQVKKKILWKEIHGCYRNRNDQALK